MTVSIPVRPSRRSSGVSRRANAPAPGAADASGFRLDIEGLRGLALILVLATHADVWFLPGGFVGLDIFFVLSGFLITGLMLAEARKTGHVSLLRFYARRARRILPLAATVLGTVLFAAVFVLNPVRASHVAGDAVAAAAYVVNWHFIAQSVDYFAFNDPSVSPVQHYWSLSVEEQFYIAWPLLVVAALALSRRFGLRLRPLLWTIVLSLGGASLGYSIWYSPLHPNAAYLSTLTRVWEIGIGCALALLLPAVIRLPRLVAATLTAAGLAAILWTAAVYPQSTPYPGWRALAPTLGTAVIIAAGTATVRSLPTRLLMTSPLRYLGRLSYAWYLWHWPFLVFAANLFGTLTPNQKLVVIALSGIPTVVSHYLVEERFRRSRKLGRRPRLAIAVGAACTASALGAGLAVAATRPSLPAAAPGEVLGARVVLAGDRTLEGSVDRILPAPKDAWKDRGIAFGHCQVHPWSPPISPGGNTCVFGDRSAKTTVVNIGDSHGLMYAPGLIALARTRHWRLVNLTHSGCTIADVQYEPNCDTWRENTLQRVAREHPSLIVVSAATQNIAKSDRYGVLHDGKRLTRKQSEPYLVAGLERTLRRLRQTGAKVVVIRDVSGTPDGIDGCVAAHPHDLRQCAFVPQRPQALAYDAAAARQVPGVKLIDPLPILCPNDLCPAVIGHALVYRNSYHLTATFAQTLAGWFAQELPALGTRSTRSAASHRTLQSSSRPIHPTPRDAWKDRGIAFAHCQVHNSSPPRSPGGDVCVFGDRSSKTTVVNFGDSHGLMYSPGLIALAHKRHWRLVNLTHSGCTVAEVHYDANCDAWRKNTLQRVAREHPSLIVVSTATQTADDPTRYAVLHDGKRLTRAQSEPYLVAGLVRTLRRLRQTGAKVVVIRDLAAAPDGIDHCVAAHPHDLRRCAFVPHRSGAQAFDVRAAHRVQGVKLIDPLPVLCRNGRCPAVIRRVLVYRNPYHLTATFSRTLVGWFARELPALAPAGT